MLTHYLGGSNLTPRGHSPALTPSSHSPSPASHVDQQTAPKHRRAVRQCCQDKLLATVSTHIPLPIPSQRFQQASRPTMDWGPSLEENRTGTYVASLAGSQSPKPLMVHMRKYGGITSYENTAIEVDQEIEEEEEESMM